MRRNWFEVLVCVVSVCKRMVVEWMLLSWHWCTVFRLTGFRFDNGLKLLEKEREWIWRYGKTVEWIV